MKPRGDTDRNASACDDRKRTAHRLSGAPGRRTSISLRFALGDRDQHDHCVSDADGIAPDDAGRPPDLQVHWRRTTLLLSVIQADSPRAAAQEFTHELQRAPSSAQSDEPLLGVGVDARYRPSANEEGGTIVARVGTVVIVVSGDLERVALVQLARAAMAHLSGNHASATHDGNARSTEDMGSGRQRAASL